MDKCCEIVVTYSGLARYTSQCTRKAVVEEDGKPWCKQHAPSAVKARRDARTAKYEADSTLRTEQWERQSAMVAACEGVETSELRPGILRELLDRALVSGVEADWDNTKGGP